MRLGAFDLETGRHVAVLRDPGPSRNPAPSSPGHAVAQNAERDRFDPGFLTDSARVSVFGTPDPRGRVDETVELEPITPLSALARVTSRLELIAV